MREFVTENARALLGLAPEVFPVSARLALRAKQGDPDVWQRSRFAALEQYIHDTLDDTARLRLKFLNPVGVGIFLVQRYLELTTSRLDLLKTDIAMLADVEAQLGLYEADMKRDFGFRMADIDNVLFEMVQRGDAFFDETMRLAAYLDLLNKGRIQREFEQQVVADVPATNRTQGQ